MRVAVIGGGMFGIASALQLTEAGFDVTVFEKNAEILSETSAYNTWRLHQGYHYPRSDKTARECKNGSERFRDEFPQAVVTSNTQRYCIASEGSKTSPDEFLDFCDRIGLEYDVEATDLVNPEKVSLSILAEEDHIDPEILRRVCWRRLCDSDVEVRLNAPVEHVDDVKPAFDRVVVATYGRSNTLLDGYETLQREFIHEVVEIPLIEMPRMYRNTNILILDGPFMCIDYRVRRGQSGSPHQFFWGDYIHTVHESDTGSTPDVPSKYESVLNAGFVEDPGVSNIEGFREHGSDWIPGLREAEHIGSFFTLRAKLPNKKATAARPSILEREDDIFVLFGGKLPTTVTKAQELVERLESE